MSQEKILGIWVGSSPATHDLVAQGLQKLKENKIPYFFPEDSKNYATKKESLDRPFLAGPDSAKVKSFEILWNESKVKNILGVRGGYGNLRLLPLLDKIKLKKNPEKMLWGFSDFTILQHYLYQRFKQPWVHSPFLTSQSFLLPNSLEEKYYSTGKDFTEFKLKFFAGSFKKFQQSSQIKAPIIGGNLACFASMMGTPWEVQMKSPYYLFLEDVNEKPYRVDRLLHQISHSKSFKKCRAILLGHFEETEGARVFPLIKKWAIENNINVLKGMPAGHDRPNVPIQMGKTVEILASSEDRVLLHIQKPTL